MYLSKDLLDNGVSASVKVTGDGLFARIKSRFFSAVDRYGGNVVDQHNPDIEDAIATKRAMTDGRVRLINEVSNQAMKRLKADPEFAQRAIENQFGTIFRQQANEDAVHVEAAEVLKLSPPKQDSVEGGPDKLSEEFLDRFEPRARMASSDEMRKKWGRVLAEEVKAPGIFTVRAIRIVDELDAETAQLFERFCGSLFGNVVPKVLVDLTFSEKATLTDAGLLLDPGLGQIQKMTPDITLGDEKYHATALGNHGFGIPAGSNLPPSKDSPLTNHDRGFAIPVYVLTDAGAAIATIFEAPKDEVFESFLDLCESTYPDVKFMRFNYDPLGLT
jgi:hypothetical protein